MAIDGSARVVTNFFPQIALKVRKVLEKEFSIQARSDAAGRAGRFNGDRARAAEGVEQCNVRLPAGKHQQAAGKVFFKRRFAFVAPPAALKERFTAHVEVKRAVALINIGKNAHVRMHAINVGARLHEVVESVADAVLDAQQREVKAS